MVFIPHIDLLTRLELFLRRARVAPLALARATSYSRQHLLRVRLGEANPTRRLILDVTAACGKVSGEAVTPGTLFERGDELFRSPHQRLSRLFAPDLKRLAVLLEDVTYDDWSERVLAAGIASETTVGQLLRAGSTRTDREPRQAATIFSTAAAMATRLAGTAPELAASLQAHALKGRANALCHLGRFVAALADLELASSLFLEARYCTNEAGRVAYTRGMVLFKTERWVEGRNAAQEARARFVAAGDARRAAYADLLLAAILFDEGNPGLARETWLRLLGILADLGDWEALARVWQNLGACEIRRGDARAARFWLQRAAAKFRELGLRTELVRTRWNIATYLATFRTRDSGVRALQHVAREFSELGALADAACVGLDAIELMLDGGTPPAALTRYAQDIASILADAGLAVSAATALDQLRRIARAADRQAVVAAVRAALREAAAECLSRERAQAGGTPPARHRLTVGNRDSAVEDDDR